MSLVEVLATALGVTSTWDLDVFNWELVVVGQLLAFLDPEMETPRDEGAGSILY